MYKRPAEHQIVDSEKKLSMANYSQNIKKKQNKTKILKASRKKSQVGNSLIS